MIASRSHRGSVDRSQVSHLAQHEIDTANRLASLGFHVVFRQPDELSTADAFVNAVRTEFKWSSSSRPGNIKRQITRKRNLKGPRYVLDTTHSPLPIDRVVALARQLCDEFADGQIASIMVIDQPEATGSVLMQIVGEEVPQWRL